tara:strand:+ start:174 stop:974 length:801 start_codon:yes stop_codon:yes gene_type:complete
MIIIDVGACTGEYTDHCFSNYDVERVIMVEPLEQNLEYLSYKYSQNETLGKKTSIIAGAISDYSGVGHLYPKIKFDRITNPDAVKEMLIAHDILNRKVNESDSGYFAGEINHGLTMPPQEYYQALADAGFFVGNDGSCLDLLFDDYIKNNDLLRSFYDPTVRIEIGVTTISNVMEIAKIDKIDILKLDVEGSEYKILKNILDENLHEKIDLIFFEDHLDKRANMLELRTSVLQRIKALGIEDMFFTQYEEFTYDIPLVDTKMWKDL